MSGSNKVYEGDLYKFTLGKQIGMGGNGKVFEANISNPQSNEVCVVKILSLNKWREKEMKELRYKRFHKEIHKVLEFQNEIPGVMKILDFHCPDKMQENCKVWYLMYKAETFYKFSNDNNFDVKKKVQYLLELSNILCTLHEKGYSHRDIKVDNLLVLENQLMLADFGLIWNISDDRITGEDDRLGPYYICPPELENRDIDMDDFRPSDVYLFAKVAWMVLKNDTFGFRGGYKRNSQFYLKPIEFGITTFEPIQKLLEESTKINMNERIDMKECRELIIAQLTIMNEDMLNKALSYRFDELEIEMANNKEPDERVYRKLNSIVNVLEEFTPISNIIIEGANEIINSDSISKWIVNNSIVFTSKKYGQTCSYLCYPDYIKFSNEKEGFELHTKKIEREDIHSEFVSYKESRMLKWGMINNNIFLDEQLVILFEKKNYLMNG